MNTKEQIEQLFNIKLQSTYSSREDENPDEEYGHYEQYECIENPLEVEDVEPPVIKVYDRGLVQLYHDATPYPVSANSHQMAKRMMHDLWECPVRVEDLTEWDWINFIQSLNNQYEH